MDRKAKIHEEALCKRLVVWIPDREWSDQFDQEVRTGKVPRGFDAKHGTMEGLPAMLLPLEHPFFYRWKCGWKTEAQQARLSAQGWKVWYVIFP